MSRSKGVLFERDEQLAGRLCHGMAHPAGVRLISRLVNGNAIPFADLIAGMPIDRSTSMQHISILERLGFLERALLHTKRGGYRLNLKLFRECSMASRRLLRVDGTVRQMIEDGVELDVG